METTVSSTHLPLPRTEPRGPAIPALQIPELDQCVHCGLCLTQCPTYRVTRLETESPRGRIHLVRAAGEGRISTGERFAAHLNLCLMCRACETACPSGVKYGRIAEAAREVIGPPGSALSRAVARVLPRRLREMEALLPPVPARFFTPEAEVLPSIGTRRARVGLLNGCIMPLLFGDINAATVRVLRRNGCEVVIPKGQGCCGALNVHNGETTAAKAMAKRNIDAFLAAGVDAVIVNAAGCGATMKEYDHLLRNDSGYAEKAARFSALCRDASEFLADLGLTGPLGPVDMTVTYQDPCHLAHGQKVRAQPRQLLAAIPGLTLIEMEASDRCCGSAGIYNVTHPEMSRTLLDEKMTSIGRTGAEAVVAPNPGCMLQLRYGAQRAKAGTAVYHLMDLLDQAYQAAEDDAGRARA